MTESKIADVFFFVAGKPFRNDEYIILMTQKILKFGLHALLIIIQSEGLAWLLQRKSIIIKQL